MHTVFTTREFRLDEEEEHKLGKREGYHREIDTLATNRQQRKASTEHCGRQRTGDDAHLGA